MSWIVWIRFTILKSLRVSKLIKCFRIDYGILVNTLSMIKFAIMNSLLHCSPCFHLEEHRRAAKKKRRSESILNFWLGPLSATNERFCSVGQISLSPLEALPAFFWDFRYFRVSKYSITSPWDRIAWSTRVGWASGAGKWFWKQDTNSNTQYFRVNCTRFRNKTKNEALYAMTWDSSQSFANRHGLKKVYRCPTLSLYDLLSRAVAEVAAEQSKWKPLIVPKYR